MNDLIKPVMKVMLVLLGISLLFAIITGFLVASLAAQERPALPVVDTLVATQEVPDSKPSLIQRVEPAHGQTEVSASPKVIVTLTDPVGDKKVDIKVEPAFEFGGSFDRDGRVLTLTTRTPLKAATKYRISAVIDKTLVYSWEFTTATDSLSQAEVTALNQLKARLPHRADHFWIEYKALTDTFFVYIDASPVDTYKQQALQFFRDGGVTNTANLKITYVAVGAAVQR